MQPVWVLSTAVVVAILRIHVVRADDITGKVSGVDDRQNVIVYVEKADGKFDAPKDHAVMDQRNMAFVPHVLPVLSGTTVDFPNTDTVRHNVYSTKAKKFNLGIYPVGVTKTEVMDIPGAQVVPLLCAIHSQLAAFVIVLQNPYYATASSDGTFAIKNVPAGTYTVIAWHEKQDDGELPRQKVTLGGKGAGASIELTFKKDHGRSGD